MLKNSHKNFKYVFCFDATFISNFDKFAINIIDFEEKFALFYCKYCTVIFLSIYFKIILIFEKNCFKKSKNAENNETISA